MKILSGKDLSGFIKERQAHQVKSFNTPPALLILRDNDSPVITKYVQLKQRYGDDIGVKVIDFYSTSTEELADQIKSANTDPKITGIIIQLPLINLEKTEELCNLITPQKDVDGLGEHATFDSATATAINWLLAGYDIKLKNQKIALVGRGKLVGAPLEKMFRDSGYDITTFEKGDDLSTLNQFDIIITATGVPGLITNSHVKPGACIVDAGTASENGILKGDVADEVRNRSGLTAITPTTGGVGPLTVTCLFDHVIQTSV